MISEYYSRAQKDFDEGKFLEASKNCAEVLMIKPDHFGSHAMEKKISSRAKTLYEEGYILEELNPEQAVQKWSEVIGISLPSNEYYQKAKARIKKYEKYIVKE